MITFYREFIDKFGVLREDRNFTAELIGKLFVIKLESG